MMMMMMMKFVDLCYTDDYTKMFCSRLCVLHIVINVQIFGTLDSAGEMRYIKEKMAFSGKVFPFCYFPCIFDLFLFSILNNNSKLCR